MINKDFKWMLHMVGIINAQATSKQYDEFLKELNDARTLFSAKCIISRWLTILLG